MLGFIYGNFKDTEQNLEKVSRLAPNKANYDHPCFDGHRLRAAAAKILAQIRRWSWAWHVMFLIKLPCFFFNADNGARFFSVLSRPTEGQMDKQKHIPAENRFRML